MSNTLTFMDLSVPQTCSDTIGLILVLCPANERRRYKQEILYEQHFGIHGFVYPTNVFWFCTTDYKFALSKWETALFCSDVPHWLGARLESTLTRYINFIHAVLRPRPQNKGKYLVDVKYIKCKYMYVFIQTIHNANGSMWLGEDMN